MRISFIIPSRNNLKYLKQAVGSIQEHYGSQHDIVLLDDASTDGTWDWINSLQGDHIVAYQNKGPERQGHTILYDKGVEISKTDVFSILHADMVVAPGYVENLLKHLQRGTVVAATRVEPPLHPPGPEKFVRLFGTEPEEFKKEDFLQFVQENSEMYKDQTTNGIFAPWCMYREDFEAIGGHDPLFAPMELEDSDIFNRMYLAGYNLVQSRDSFTYHMTCRGSRFKDGLEIEAEIPLPDGTIWYKPKDSEEYKALRAIKFRDWFRKWGSNVLHDELMMPKVSPRYNIGFVVKGCNSHILEALEPWCDTMYIEDGIQVLTTHYLDKEQKNTSYDLSQRIQPFDNERNNDIILEFDARQFTETSFQIIQHLSQIIKESGEIGSFELDIFKIHIMSLTEYQNNLIICKK